jgi:hypothetical protein
MKRAVAGLAISCVFAVPSASAAAGFHRFYLFRCSRHGRLITCRNALGDAMRYRPR